MAFKDSHQKIKKVINYTRKVTSYACIVFLVLIAIFFIDYFIESRVAKSKGESYIPRFSLYTIISPSMVPTINVYDVIFDVKVTDPSKIKKGDVITFVSSSVISKGMTVTHRVTKVVKTASGYEYYTKGDANMFEDGATAKSSNLIGRVIFKIPQLGRVQFFLSSKTGWLLCIILPAIGIVVYDVLKLTKAMKINQKSKNISANDELPKPDQTDIKNKVIANSINVNNNLPTEVTIKKDTIQSVEPQKSIITGFGKKTIVISNDDLPKKAMIELPKMSESNDLPKLK